MKKKIDYNDELENEKLKLEIEELKTKIKKSNKNISWGEHIKPLIPILITLIIAISSWIITGKFNQSQLKIIERKNETEKEIAKINASLSYLNFMAEVSNGSLKQQANIIISPILPQESSFYIAVENLDNNPYILDVLLRKYKNDFFEYLYPFTESSPKLFLSLDKVITSDKVILIFKYLNERQLLDDFSLYIFSINNSSKKRFLSILNYIIYLNEDYKKLDRNVRNKLINYKIESISKMISDSKLKNEIYKALYIVLNEDQYNSKVLEQITISFWENYDVSIGQLPKENDIDNFIFINRFLKSYKKDYFISLLSKSLYTKLNQLTFSSLEIDRICLILNSYCVSKRMDLKKGFSSYLTPESSYLLIEKILPTLNNDSKRKYFANNFLNLKGYQLFMNISQNKEIGEKYAKLIIKFYEKYWNENWYLSSFFSEISKKYPHLKPLISDKWGF